MPGRSARARPPRVRRSATESRDAPGPVEHRRPHREEPDVPRLRRERRLERALRLGVAPGAGERVRERDPRGDEQLAGVGAAPPRAPAPTPASAASSCRASPSAKRSRGSGPAASTPARGDRERLGAVPRLEPLEHDPDVRRRPRRATPRT